MVLLSSPNQIAIFRGSDRQVCFSTRYGVFPPSTFSESHSRFSLRRLYRFSDFRSLRRRHVHCRSDGTSLLLLLWVGVLKNGLHNELTGFSEAKVYTQAHLFIYVNIRMDIHMNCCYCYNELLELICTKTMRELEAIWIEYDLINSSVDLMACIEFGNCLLSWILYREELQTANC